MIKDFITPIDRDDIIMLTHKIDDLVDCIDEVVINIDILNICDLYKGTKLYTEEIYNCCLILDELIEKYKKTKKYEELKLLILEVNQYEEKGDDMYRKAMRKLYKEEKNPISIMQWTTLYNCLEECFDSCESIADTINEIIMKNG